MLATGKKSVPQKNGWLKHTCRITRAFDGIEPRVFWQDGPIENHPASETHPRDRRGGWHHLASPGTIRGPEPHPPPSPQSESTAPLDLWDWGGDGDSRAHGEGVGGDEPTQAKGVEHEGVGVQAGQADPEQQPRGVAGGAPACRLCRGDPQE